MPEYLDINERVSIYRHELSWRFSRSSGPGGQSVNTADSRVELIFDLANSMSIPQYLRKRAIDYFGNRLVNGALVVATSEHRSQLQNRRAAEERLVELLRAAFLPPPQKRRPTKPSAGAKERRLSEKRHRSEIKRNRRADE